MNWEWVGVNKFQLMIVGVGLGLMVGGVIMLKREEAGARVEISAPQGQNNQFPIASITPRTETSKVIIEVAGAVERPGVYELVLGARVVEALAKAGGMSAKADRDWVSGNINQAATIKDGGKIYIPTKQQAGNNFQNPISNFQINSNDQFAKEIKNNMNNENKISVNTASQSELESLWGIGEARALAIITNRPYGSIEEIQIKAKVPANVVEKNKDKMSL